MIIANADESAFSSLRPHPSLSAVRRLRIPLPFAHARDRDALEYAALGEGIAVRECLGFSAAPHVDDEAAPDRFGAVVVLGCARKNQYFFLASQVLAVRTEDFLTDRGGIRIVYARNDPEHFDSPIELDGVVHYAPSHQEIGPSIS